MFTLDHMLHFDLLEPAPLGHADEGAGPGLGIQSACGVKGAVEGVGWSSYESSGNDFMKSSLHVTTYTSMRLTFSKNTLLP